MLQSKAECYSNHVAITLLTKSTSNNCSGSVSSHGSMGRCEAKKSRKTKRVNASTNQNHHLDRRLTLDDCHLPWCQRCVGVATNVGVIHPRTKRGRSSVPVFDVNDARTQTVYNRICEKSSKKVLKKRNSTVL